LNRYVLLEVLALAKTRLVEPVIRFVAVISSDEAVTQWAVGRITEHWGATAEISPPQSFEAGGYYQAEMGARLSKILVALAQPQDPAGLAQWKTQTNGWEREAATEFAGPQVRPLNLDPGYITQAKLVLATAKDRDHRIYLRDGIFAEVTLSYVGGRWIDHRWTYPDYRTEAVADFANRCRARLREHLQASGVFRTGKKHSFL
jgi:hypothetical protein